MEFGPALQHVMASRGLSVADLSEETGLSQVEILDVLEGRQRAKARFLFRVSAVKALEDKEKELFDMWYESLK